jgi:Protein tyrosine and serine/threonine kinase
VIIFVTVCLANCFVRQADVYTFGLLVWEMLNVRSNPFGEYLMNDDEDNHDGTTTKVQMTEGQVDRAIIHDGLRPTIPRHVWCQSLVDVVSSSWAPEIEDRPTMAENYLSLQIIFGKLKAQGEMISAVKEEQSIRRQQREQRRKERRIKKKEQRQQVALLTLKQESGDATAATAGDDEMLLGHASEKTEEESAASSSSSSPLSPSTTTTIMGSGRTTEVVVV